MNSSIGMPFFGSKIWNEIKHKTKAITIKFKNILERKSHSLQSIYSKPITPLYNEGEYSFKRASLCNFKKGSLTVEAAFVLPLVILAVSTICFYIKLIGIQTESEQLLIEEAKVQAINTCWKTNTSEPIISINNQYSYEIPVSIIPIRHIKYDCKVKVRAWVGSNSLHEEKVVSNDELVYITDNESVYHRKSNCTHLDLSVFVVPSSSIKEKRNRDGGIYKICGKCVKKDDSNYYITFYGDKYHGKSQCSSISRRVRMCWLKDVKHLRACSRCG